MHRVALGQSARTVARDYRRIITTRDRHGHYLRSAVRSFHGDAVCVRLTAHELVVRSVHRVRPHACTGEAKFSVTVAASHVGLSRKHVSRAVHVGGGQRASRCLHRVALGQGARTGARDYSRIVGSIDRHSHHLCGAVGSLYSERVGECLPYIQCLYCRIAVIECVSPHASG